MPKPQDNFSFNSISQPTHTWESEDRLCLRLRGSLYSFDSISRRPIALTALLLFLCPPTPFFFSFPNHKSVSFVSAALEGVHSGDNSAAPLLPLARSEKQEDDVVREGRGTQSESAASVCTVEENHCPTVLRRPFRKPVDYRCPGSEQPQREITVPVRPAGT